MGEEKKGTGTWDGVTNGPDPHDADNRYAMSMTGTPPNGTAYTDFLARLNDTANGGAYCFAGHCDWRLPSLSELQGIVDLSAPGCADGSAPCIDPLLGITNTYSAYWSTDLSGSSGSIALGSIVDFAVGGTHVYGRMENMYVRAVRDDPTPGPTPAITPTPITPMPQTPTPTPVPCRNGLGRLVNGHCWYQSNVYGENCDTTCQNAGSSCDSTVLRTAGDAGTDQTCQAIATAFDAGYFFWGTSDPWCGTSGAGCSVRRDLINSPDVGSSLRCVDGYTTCHAIPPAGVTRFCACTN